MLATAAKVSATKLAALMAASLATLSSSGDWVDRPAPNRGARSAVAKAAGAPARI